MRHRHLLLVPLVIALLCASSAAHAGGGSSSLVIAQLYASGGNSGATYANDYVQLFNRGTSSVDLTGWTVQYASAASTSWSPTALSGTIAPGRAYLVQLASGGTNGTAYLATCPKFDQDAFATFRDELRFRGPERFPPDSLQPGST